MIFHSKISNRLMMKNNLIGYVRNIFIKTESTPNPQSMKFIPEREVLPESYGTGMHIESKNGRDILRSPLAKSIFKVPGLKSVFFGRDFITVTKESNENWHRLKPMIFSEIFDFFAEGKPVMDDTPVISDTTILDTDDEVVAAIKELMETRIRPSVQEDGGDIFFDSFEPSHGIVRVRLAGSCVGCPSSSVTLRNGVENMLMHYIPEVKGIEEVTANSEDGDDGGDKDMKLEFRPDFVAKKDEEKKEGKENM